MHLFNLKAPDNLYFLALFLSCFGMACFVPLQNFYGIIFFWSIAVIAYINISKLEFTNFRQLLVLAVIIRIGFLAATPMISTDVFRFLWDGELIHLGINPYDYTPDALTDHPKLQTDYFRELFNNMGWLSRDNHSCYPFVKQILFWCSTLFSDQVDVNVFLMRLLLIAFDIGTIFFLQKIFVNLSLPLKRVNLFAFNPLIIVEFTGGLHFEGVLIFFLVVAINAWFSQKWIFGAVMFALAVQVKLIPLMFLPFVFFYAGWKKSIIIYSWIAVVVGCTTMVWLKSYNVQNFLFSIQLYFGQFEFNAGVYVFFKYYAYEKYGYFRLAFYGKLLSKITFLGVLLIAVFRKFNSKESFVNGLFFASILYYFLVPIVHPWYIALPFTLGLFTRFNVVLIWTLVIPISYIHYQEKFNFIYYIAVAIEYVLVLGIFIFEMKTKKSFQIFGFSVFDKSSNPYSLSQSNQNLTNQ